MIKALWIYSLILISSAAYCQSEYVDLDDFDTELLNKYLVDYTNQLRKRKRRDSLAYYRTLDAAAQNQAQYMADRKYLGHFQKNRKLKTVKKRVEVLGGDADYIGENVQYISIDYEIERANGQLTYQALARELGDNWKTSKGHYANMIDKAYEGVSHQFAIKDGRLYACQVFSSKPFVPVFDFQIGQEFNVKNKKPCFDCDRTISKSNTGRINFGWYYVSNDSIFYYNYKRTFYSYEIPFFRRTIYMPATKRNLHAIFKRQGKLTIDFIHQSQFSCVGKYAYSGALNYDGYYLGYIDRKMIKKKNTSSSNKYVKLYVGQIPESKDENYQIDFFLTKKDRPCIGQGLVFVNPDYFKPYEFFQLKHPIITVGPENKIKDSLLVKVPFSRSSTSEDSLAFLDLNIALKQFKLDAAEIVKVKYTGIASIEGTEVINKKLIAKRAQLISSLISSYYPNVPMDYELIENFDDFRIGLQNKEGERWLKAGNEELRAYANKYKDKDKITALLDETRQSEITIFTVQDFSSVKLTPSVSNLKKLISEVESKAALLVYQQLTKKAVAGDTLTADSLMNIVIPQEEKFGKLLWEQFVFELNFKKDPITAAKLNELYRRGAIPTEADYLEYRMMFNLFYEEELCVISDFNIVLKSVKSKNKRNWLKSLHIINAFEQGSITYNLSSELANLAVKGRFNVFQAYFVSQYIISYNGLYYAKILLEKYAKQSRQFPKLYQQYLKLSYYFDGFEDQKQFKTDMRVFNNLANLDSPDFCSFFKWYHTGVRALEKEPISALFCRECH